ncbi:MAG: apolipoprotein N-acyltransferase [Candidatus Brocadiaceae bacterium]
MRAKNFIKIPILSFLTILFMCLSFPPAGVGYLAWIAFIPWFILIITEEKYVYLSALFIGVVFFFIQLYWLYYIAAAAWIMLSLYCSAYFLFFAFITRLVVFRLKWPLGIVAPCVWASLEFIRSFLLSGFPWFFIGHSQYQYLPVIQIADITGVYGISFIIVMINGCITDWILHFLNYRNKTTHALSSFLSPGKKMLFFGLTCIFPLALLTAAMLYGFWWLRNYKPQEGPTLCMAQGNIPQDLKFQSTEEDDIRILKIYSELSMGAKGNSIDLLIWPETMIPGLLNINPELTGRKIDILSQLTVLQLSQELRTPLLLGGLALTLHEENQVYFNSAYYYNKEGTFVDRYDKIHLVPFGEFTPLKDYFPFLAKLVPYEVGLTHGEKRTVFHLDTPDNKHFAFGSSICYEDTVPSLIRAFKKEGADFMVNITNDGWFRNSAELDQHLAIMVFRAVENRMTMARAANTGISSFVAPDGAIYDKLTDLQGKYREISGTLINRIKLIKSSNTIYTLWGDWFSILCLTTSGIMIFLALFGSTFSLTFPKE